MNGEYDGAQDYDFVLRCVEKTDKIRHIPKILYHWRACEGLQQAVQTINPILWMQVQKR